MSHSPGTTLTGTVLDPTGAAVAGAHISLITVGAAELLRSETDGRGQFSWTSVPAGAYVVAIQKPGFGLLQRSVRVVAGHDLLLQFSLSLGYRVENITVTSLRGSLQETFQAPEFLTVADQRDATTLSSLILPQTLRELAGVHLQQTTTSQGSPFVRGLTGQHVVALVNGVRFNNSTFRPGANQYTALLDPAFAERVEVMHGSASTQYGSDALGGALNVLTPAIALPENSFQLHGRAGTFFASADQALGSELRLSGARKRWGFFVEGSGRRAGDLRTGHDIDSHSVATRLLGLPSSVLGDRLAQTGYVQYGVTGKLFFQATTKDALSLEYLRGAQLGASRYDQLNGGLGNLLHEFDPQVADVIIGRYNRAALGWLDFLSATFSFNSQEDDRRYQNVNNSSRGLHSNISVEFNRPNVFGYQSQATTHLGSRAVIAFGGEFYDEYIGSTRRDLIFNNASGDYTDLAIVRARFPNGAGYRSLGLFVQQTTTLVPNRLTGNFGFRFSRFSYRQSPDGNPLTASGAPSVPPFSTSFADTTFNVGGVLRITNSLNLTGRIARGFRAPNVNDLASIGVSGLGFEISPEEGSRLGGLAARLDAPQQAPRPITQLSPEVLYSYEVGLKFRGSRCSGAVSAFDSEFTNFIERRTVLLPPSAVGSTIGGQTIVKQDPSGAVYTALSNTSVFVRANAGHVQFRGAEAEFSADLTRQLALTVKGALVRGTDVVTNLPPSVENGIPPGQGSISLRWQPGTRYWIETSTYLADAQRRFSDNDFQQARIGGIRTKGEITNFFNNGAVALGLVRNGILLATNENLNQVLRRVLGPDLNSKVPLFTSNPGYGTLNVRGGYQLGEHSKLALMLENVFDKNYRTMGSGVDGPGRSAWLRYTISF